MLFSIIFKNTARRIIKNTKIYDVFDTIAVEKINCDPLKKLENFR